MVFPEKEKARICLRASTVYSSKQLTPHLYTFVNTPTVSPPRPDGFSRPVAQAFGSPLRASVSMTLQKRSSSLVVV